MSINIIFPKEEKYSQYHPSQYNFELFIFNLIYLTILANNDQIGVNGQK